MIKIVFSVPGKIVPKQSTRFYNGHCVPQKRVKEYAEKVKSEYLSHYPINSLIWTNKEPLEVDINFYFKVPKSASKEKRCTMLRFEYPTKIPDLDNCTKSILDALKGVAFADDSQIVSLKARKVWSEEDVTGITIREVSR